MADSSKSFIGIKFLVATASFIIIVAGLRAAQAFLVPFSFAVFLSIIGGTAVAWLHRRRVPTILAILVVTLVVMGALSGTVVIFGSSVNAFTKTIPDYQEEFEKVVVSSQAWLNERGIEIVSANIIQSIDPAALLEAVGKTLKGLVSALSGTLLMLIIMVFIMFEAAEFRLKLRAALGTSVDMNRFENVATDVQRYLAIKTVTSIITGTLVWGWVALMGVSFPLLWGIIAFFLNYIPFIGSIIAAIPAVLLAIVEISFGGALGLGAGYFIINTGVSNFLEPILMGRRLGLSPLIVFLSLVFWGYVWGPAGMLLSVPLTMLVRIFLEHSEDFNWVATLMGRKPRNIAP